MPTPKATYPSTSPYPIDTDCDFVAQYAAVPAPTADFPLSDESDLLAAARDAEFLSRSYVLHAIGVPRAVDTLGQRILSGQLDLCDDQLVDALECRRRRVLLGDHPTFAAVASVAASALGLSSPLAEGPAPNTSVAALRGELQRAFTDIACGEPHQVTCAQKRFKALRRRYLGGFATSLTGDGRLTIRKDAIALQRDEQVLSSPTLVSAYGGPCGDDPLSIALAILERPPSEQVSGQERLAFVDKFHRLVELDREPELKDVEDFVGAAQMIQPARPCHGCCESQRPGGAMVGTG